MARMTATTTPEVGIVRMRPFGTTIFAEMSALAARTGAVNLGQGFPDTDGPPEMLDAAAEAMRSGRNQYPPGPGIPELRAAVARHQQRFWGLTYDPDGEILVTAGATEAIAASDPRACASPATRWSASSRTTTRTPPASRWPRARCAR